MADRSTNDSDVTVTVELPGLDPLIEAQIDIFLAIKTAEDAELPDIAVDELKFMKERIVERKEDFKKKRHAVKEEIKEYAQREAILQKNNPEAKLPQPDSASYAAAKVRKSALGGVVDILKLKIEAVEKRIQEKS